MATFSNKAWFILAVLVFLFGIIVGYSFGKTIGFQAGQEALKNEVNQAKTEILNLQKQLEELRTR